MGGSVPAGEEGFFHDVEALAAAINDAVEHLADLDAEDDAEAFARMLEQLAARVQVMLALPAATGARQRVLEAALGHLREAHDLLDDGEPSDAVAVEVMAAVDGLRRPPGG